VLEDRDNRVVNARSSSAGASFMQRASLTWPAVLITLGLMFLAAEFVPHWGLRRTWPVLLVVIGVLKLIESGRPPRPPAGPRI
jgi:LiaI-LiaF-like transmembrane region